MSDQLRVMLLLLLQTGSGGAMSAAVPALQPLLEPPPLVLLLPAPSVVARKGRDNDASLLPTVTLLANVRVNDDM